MDALEQAKLFEELLVEKNIVSAADLDGLEGRSEDEKEALKASFQQWVEKINEDEDDELNFKEVLHEEYPSREDVNELDRANHFKEIKKKMDLAVEFNGWSKDKKIAYRQNILSELGLEGDTKTLKVYKVAISDEGVDNSEFDAIGFTEFSDDNELDYKATDWEKDKRNPPPNQSTYEQTYAGLLYQDKNIILEGPPGTGKTYALKGIVKQLSEETTNGGLGEKTYPNTGRGKFAVTMHPSTSYEDFIEGLRPTGDGTSFAYQPGTFVEIVKHAIRNPNHQHVVLLDELNRCNVPSVMGDLLTVVERGKRSKRSKSNGESVQTTDGDCVEYKWLTATNCEEPSGAPTGLGMSLTQKKHVLGARQNLQIVTNPRLEDTDLWEVVDRHKFKMSDNYLNGDYLSGHPDGNTLLRLQPAAGERMKDGLCMLIWDGIGHPVLSEDWQRYFLDLDQTPPTNPELKVLTSNGVRTFHVCDGSLVREATLDIPDKRRYVGKIELRELVPVTCTCDVKLRKHVAESCPPSCCCCPCPCDPIEGGPAHQAHPAPPGEEAAPADDEAAPADGEAAPADGEAAPADGEAAPADGEAASDLQSEEESKYYWCNGCDSNWSKANRTEVRLSGSRKLLHIPENLLIVGTMNTTDRSVAPLDAALRRRFIFLRIDPLDKIPRKDFSMLIPGVRELFDETHTLWQKMNKKLEKCLGLDATLGHSYLFDLIENLKEVEDIEKARRFIRNCWKYAMLPQIADMLDATGQAKEIWDEITDGSSDISDGLRAHRLKLKFGESKSMAFNRTVVVEVPSTDDD